MKYHLLKLLSATLISVAIAGCQNNGGSSISSNQTAVLVASPEAVTVIAGTVSEPIQISNVSNTALQHFSVSAPPANTYITADHTCDNLAAHSSCNVYVNTQAGAQSGSISIQGSNSNTVTIEVTVQTSAITVTQLTPSDALKGLNYKELQITNNNTNSSITYSLSSDLSNVNMVNDNEHISTCAITGQGTLLSNQSCNVWLNSTNDDRVHGQEGNFIIAYTEGGQSLSINVGLTVSTNLYAGGQFTSSLAKFDSVSWTGISGAASTLTDLIINNVGQLCGIVNDTQVQCYDGTSWQTPISTSTPVNLNSPPIPTLSYLGLDSEGQLCATGTEGSSTSQTNNPAVLGQVYCYDDQAQTLQSLLLNAEGTSAYSLTVNAQGNLCTTLSDESNAQLFASCYNPLGQNWTSLGSLSATSTASPLFTYQNQLIAGGQALASPFYPSISQYNGFSWSTTNVGDQANYQATAFATDSDNTLYMMAQSTDQLSATFYNLGAHSLIALLTQTSNQHLGNHNVLFDESNDFYLAGSAFSTVANQTLPSNSYVITLPDDNSNTWAKVGADSADGIIDANVNAIVIASELTLNLN